MTIPSESAMAMAQEKFGYLPPFGLLAVASHLTVLEEIDASFTKGAEDVPEANRASYMQGWMSIRSAIRLQMQAVLALYPGPPLVIPRVS